GDNVTVDYTLTDGAGGTVTFFDGSDVLGTVNVGDKFVINNLTEGIHFITAVYNGDDKFNVSSSNVVAVEVKAKGNESDDNVTNKTTPDININSPESIVEGENATVSVILPADATGNVTIGNVTVPVVNGTASAVVSGLPVGNNTVPVVYSGDDKYNSVETSANVTVDEKETPKENATVSIDAPDVTEGENATITVSLPEDATGNVTVGNVTVPVVNGTATVSIPDLAAGNYSIPVVYSGDDKYNSVETSANVTVDEKETPKENATVSIDAPDVTEGDNATITVSLPEYATGNVTATVGNETYTAPVVNGTATISIPDLAAGNYSVPVTYSGDEKYNPVTKDAALTVEEEVYEIVSAPDVSKYYHGSERFVVNITDSKGNPVANKSVVIEINGMTYNRTTGASGTTSVAINLNPGVYNVTTTVGNETINSVVTVLTTVNGTDLVKIYKNDSQYYATFRDSEGNYLADGTAVRFNINGVMYDRFVRGNEGLAKLNINLYTGEYILTAMNLQTGEESSNNITVLAKIVENYDITKYYRNATHYTVKVLGDDGNPVGAGEVVTFNINGVFYNRTTDENGIVKLNINLQPGDYIITAEYKGFMVSNNIKVLPTLSAQDLTKTYGTSDPFIAHLVDGQGNPLGNQKIEFNINGVMYYRTTDSQGNAKLNINLIPGEYIITSKYNDAVIGNIVKVNA
ncbi:Ig-like domain repeat protein, partial [Methanobrevibacter sp.]|uniref:Ig-like domain repeat protein n=1 Tax=Methanobrevibacter sp. TaxID=66852 RepID=UPI00388FE125